jgi:hypothetical protein
MYFCVDSSRDYFMPTEMYTEKFMRLNGRENEQNKKLFQFLFIHQIFLYQISHLPTPTINCSQACSFAMESDYKIHTLT